MKATMPLRNSSTRSEFRMLNQWMRRVSSMNWLLLYRSNRCDHSVGDGSHCTE